eukprot:6203998-Pleurochrysis_carterae.AAC.1
MQRLGALLIRQAARALMPTRMASWQRNAEHAAAEGRTIRLVAAKGLSSEDSEMCIGMRAQHRMQVAPEVGGGWVLEVRQVGKI